MIALELVNTFVDYCTQFISEGGLIFGFILILLESFIPVLPLGIFVALNVNAFGSIIGITLSWIATCLGCFLSYLILSYISERILNKILPKKL